MSHKCANYLNVSLFYCEMWNLSCFWGRITLRINIMSRYLLLLYHDTYFSPTYYHVTIACLSRSHRVTMMREFFGEFWSSLGGFSYGLGNISRLWSIWLIIYESFYWKIIAFLPFMRAQLPIFITIGWNILIFKF